MKHVLALSVGLVLAASSIDAFAAEGNGGFIRGEIGNSNVSIEGEDGNDTAYGIRGGYFFNANVGVEAFYSTYGEDSTDGATADLTGFGIGIVGKANLEGAHTGLFVSGRAGVARTNADVSIPALGNFDDTDTRAYIGAGIGYDFNENFGLSLDVTYQQPKLFDQTFKITTAGVGVEYRF